LTGWEQNQQSMDNLPKNGKNSLKGARQRKLKGLQKFMALILLELDY